MLATHTKDWHKRRSVHLLRRRRERRCGRRRRRTRLRGRRAWKSGRRARRQWRGWRPAERYSGWRWLTAIFERGVGRKERWRRVGQARRQQWPQYGRRRCTVWECLVAIAIGVAVDILDRAPRARTAAEDLERNPWDEEKGHQGAHRRGEAHDHAALSMPPSKPPLIEDHA